MVSVRSSYAKGYGPHNVSLPRSDKAGKISPAADDAHSVNANEANAINFCECFDRPPKVRADQIRDARHKSLRTKR